LEVVGQVEVEGDLVGQVGLEFHVFVDWGFACLVGWH
jgi:hypothetical protein